MSAFIVADGTIDLAAEEISRLRNRQQQGRDRRSSQDEQQCTEIGQELHLLNAAAVSGRYSELPECEHAQRYRWKDLTACGISMEQRVKALECLLYQCSEDPVFEIPLYDELSKAVANLALVIVGQSKAYDRAQWGIQRPESIPVRLFGI